MNVNGVWNTSDTSIGWSVSANEITEKSIQFTTPSNYGYYEFWIYAATGYNMTIYEVSIFEEASYANSTYTLTAQQAEL